MKDQFLKLAKVKNEAEFYKKFPTEDAFMAKYGKKVKKLNLGGAMESLNKLAASNTFATGVQSAGDIIGGIQKIKDDKNLLNTSIQNKELSGLALQASLTKPEQIRREYVRPDNPNMIMQPGQFQNPYGQGTNILSAKNGGEITNTFAPNTIYTNLEQAKDGFQLFKSNPDFMKLNKTGEQTDLFNFAEQGGGDYLNQITSRIGNPKGYDTSGSGKIAGGIGSIAGTLLGGPVGGMFGKFAGEKLGDLFDKKAERTEANIDSTRENINKMAMGQGAQSLQRQNVSYMKNGGVMNPQIINQFGDYRMNQLLQPDPYINTLRSGGNLRNYTPPSNRAMEIYEDGGEVNSYGLGGELQTHWGGGAETISRNPYLPGTGETVMFRGKSHDQTSNGQSGIGVTYGGNPIEVEGGEPMVELEQGGVVDPVTGEVQKSGVVFGNLEIPNQYIPMLGDEKAKGKKFKTYVKDLSGKEDIYNKLIDKSVKNLDELEIDDSYNKLTLNSFKSNILGANLNLKDIANKKIKAASLQDAINTTAQEMGIEADALAKGKVKFDKKSESEKARFGKNILKAENGTRLEQKETAKKLYESGDIKGFQKYIQEVAPDIVNTIIKEKGMPNAGTFTDALQGPRTKEAYDRFMNPLAFELPGSRMSQRTGLTEIQTPANMPGVNTTRSTSGFDGSRDSSGSEFDWMNIANQILPYVRPTDAESLDPNQLAGEMYALSTNQLEPVQAQTFQPQLSTPYDISLQDQLNANQSDYRAAQRMMGYNPAALATLNAQKYQANQQVLGEQFRLNQSMKDRVYGENRKILDDANLKNLDILDRQYGRQQEALSNTKATTQAALSSIASKYAQNQLENRQLQTYENLYNYRFDPRGRAISMNPLQQFNTDMASMSSQELEQLAKQRAAEEKTKAKSSNVARNGSIVKAFK